MAYSKQTWENLPNQTTPITAERLNHMEDGIYEAYEHGGGGETLPVGSEIDFDGTSTDIPTGWEQISDEAKVLWTNPNPTSEFASQTITLSSDDYDMLEIIYMTFNTNNQTSSVKILKGYNTRVITSLSSGTVYTRDYTYNSDTSYTIGNTTGGNDSNLYPLYIIGYKTGLFD